MPKFIRQAGRHILTGRKTLRYSNALGAWAAEDRGQWPPRRVEQGELAGTEVAALPH